MNAMRKKLGHEASKQPELPFRQRASGSGVNGRCAAEVCHSGIRSDTRFNRARVRGGCFEDGGAQREICSRASVRGRKKRLEGGRLEEAIGLYRRVIAMDPAHLRARNNLGVLLDQTGDHDVALEHFQAAVELQPESAEVLTNLGAALASQGRYDEAEIELRKAARLDPGGIDVRANLGILYFRRGLYSQSDQELRWVCDNDPDHTLAHFYRGEALNRLGRSTRLWRCWSVRHIFSPIGARIYYLMGILYDKKNLSREAGVMYRKAKELTDR